MSIPNNIVAQEEETDEDYTMTEEEIKTKVTEFKTKDPKFVAIVEAISNLDLKDCQSLPQCRCFTKND